MTRSDLNLQKSSTSVLISECVVFVRQTAIAECGWRQIDWKDGLLHPILFKCQTGFRTLCLLRQTICSNLISIRRNQTALWFFIYLFIVLFQSVYLRINGWFSVQMSDKVDSGTVYFSISPSLSLSFPCNEVLLNYILMGWKQLLLVSISTCLSLSDPLLRHLYLCQLSERFCLCSGSHLL